MSYSTKIPTVAPPEYGQVYSDTNQTVTFGNYITFDNIQNNTAGISFAGPSTNVQIITPGTYKIDFVLRVPYNSSI